MKRPQNENDKLVVRELRTLLRPWRLVSKDLRVAIDHEERTIIIYKPGLQFFSGITKDLEGIVVSTTNIGPDLIVGLW